jgi:membrane protease subunit HflK
MSQSKDPWGREKKPQGPPDLEEIFRKFKNKVLGRFIKTNTSSNSDTRVNVYFGVMIGIALLILWALSGIFIVSPPERAVVVRFGKYITTLGPGPHWIPPFIESKRIVNIQNISNFAYASDMLTKDENIVFVSVVVQYRISDARNFLFNVVDPVGSLEQATASALRQAVGHNTLDDLLTVHRDAIRQQVAVQLQQIVNSYNTGLIVTDVTLQNVNAPEAVTAAFDDVIKAREDQKSYINQAKAYAKQVTANAQGQAARIAKEAEANQREAVLNAQGGVQGFLSLLPEYRASPETTRQRLYLSTMETILGQTNKVFIDQKSGTPLVYLPLDKMITAQNQNPDKISKIDNPTLPNSIINPANTALSGYPERGQN